MINNPHFVLFSFFSITGGLVKGVCHCCYVCAKVEGEICGGPWNFVGKCDKGLTCVKFQPMNFNSRGICTKIRGKVLKTSKRFKPLKHVKVGQSGSNIF